MRTLTLKKRAYETSGIKGLLNQPSGPKDAWKITPDMKFKILETAFRNRGLPLEEMVKQLNARWNKDISINSFRTVLIENGFKVKSSDKFDYGYGETKDLFSIWDNYDNIITNPPFTKQQAVKKHLLSITRKKLALLWYVKNLGNEIETKTSKNLKNIYVFNKRIEWKETKIGWLFAWYIWEKGYKGDIIIKRIDY